MAEKNKTLYIKMNELCTFCMNAVYLISVLFIKKRFKKYTIHDQFKLMNTN